MRKFFNRQRVALITLSMSLLISGVLPIMVSAETNQESRWLILSSSSSRSGFKTSFSSLSTSVSSVLSSPSFLPSPSLPLQNTQDPDKGPFQVPRASGNIKIDGHLDELDWEKALVLALPYEWLPGDNIPALVRTECLLVYDRDYLYVGFRCYDPDPKSIRAHLMDRDDTDRLIQDDHVVIMIDPFNDERRGFQFRVNPLGVQADANFSELEGYEDFSWDAIWNSKGQITDWGYSVEIALPFNQLRFPKTKAIQTWGFSAERSYPRNVRHRLISHKRERHITCVLCQVNKITGIEGISPGYNLEFDPTLTANRTDQRESIPSGSMAEGKIKADPGLTTRWGITPNLILNATINPDFSQVEADVAQLEVNTRFALRYPEKRPFFLEGADFFLTPIEAVFTRTVADPAGGVKLTGKVGRNAIGFFTTYDRINNLLFPSNQGSLSTSLDEGVWGGVFRFRHDVGQGSAVGALYTGRLSDNYANHVAGVDGFFRLSQTKTVRFQYLHSETKYAREIGQSFQQPYRSYGGGEAIFGEFSHRGRNWLYNFSYEARSPLFRADFGYVPRVDLQLFKGLVARVFWGEKGDWFNRLHFGLSALEGYTWNWNLTDRQVSLFGNYMGPWQSQVNLEFNATREFYRGQYFDLTQVVSFLEVKPVSGVRFFLMGVYGDGVDYNNIRKATSLRVIPLIEGSIGSHLNINAQHAFEKLSLAGQKIYVANLSQVKFIYNFNVRTFVRLIFQYLDMDRNPALYTTPVSPTNQTFFTQFLFSYKLNPQTVLFLGYSDNYFGAKNIDLTQTDRTFFVKLGYAWTR